MKKPNHQHRSLHGEVVGGPVPEEVTRAIALKYDGKNAPKITAKGSDEIAKRIFELAREHDVPMHEDADLAALLSRLDIGDEIPRELYITVAEVIAFAYLISGKAADYSRSG
ncbi:EscU/YscU/HrcU family type III secretion system export apparatus switch protein [Sulfuriflexus mobilis]|uniref:EscU/YscU/HrcU family type III secretion system export apparatus switch protein n=1 Tax=Sulfuriflexus mobilis TaxID=1811807 RepID=UPI000F830F9E|nr:EscU/YscU/HrcU family type III secretion system export apparatus switch protein [Sulfuriflexus mobilis]